MRLLVVEDSRRLRESLRLGLRRSGFSVDTAADGPTGLSLATKEPYDVIVLDLMLPGLDGQSILKELRARGVGADVLILSARDAVDDRVKGLDLGADDYLVKPFAFEELVARLQALTRRRYGKKSSEIVVGDLVFDAASRKVTRGGKTLDLTAREYMLLRLLAMRRGETVSRIEIEDKLYGIERFPNSNVVASTISMLRTKLGEPPLIHTRRGLGYVMDAQES
jgi:DNA-binding response OmpR family regulator